MKDRQRDDENEKRKLNNYHRAIETCEKILIVIDDAFLNVKFKNEAGRYRQFSVDKAFLKVLENNNIRVGTYWS